MINLTNNTQKKISFGNSFQEIRNGKSIIKKEFNDNGILLSILEKDPELDRFIKKETFDETGKLLSEQKFEYFPNKTVETFKGEEFNYVRTISKIIKDSLTHITEEYVSSNPSKNYIYEITRDATGKIIKWLNNGKKVI